MFVTIDPGAMTGWAIWNAYGLIACGLGDPRLHPNHVVTSERQQDVIDDVWIEYPVIYPRSKARPNDILKLAQVAAEFGGGYKTCGVEVHYVEPATWKGQLSKAMHHPRVWAALRDFERAVVDVACTGMSPTKRENVLDAIGLGQWVRLRSPTGK